MLVATRPREELTGTLGRSAREVGPAPFSHLSPPPPWHRVGCFLRFRPRNASSRHFELAERQSAATLRCSLDGMRPTEGRAGFLMRRSGGAVVALFWGDAPRQVPPSLWRTKAVVVGTSARAGDGTVSLVGGRTRCSCRPGTTPRSQERASSERKTSQGNREGHCRGDPDRLWTAPALRMVASAQGGNRQFTGWLDSERTMSAARRSERSVRSRARTNAGARRLKRRAWR